MDEQTLRRLTREVETGRLSRRRFTQILVGLGLTAPMAARVLGTVSAAHAQAKEPLFTPTRRGGGGSLRTLWWQAPTLLNPHFATERRLPEPLWRYARTCQTRARPARGARHTGHGGRTPWREVRPWRRLQEPPDMSDMEGDMARHIAPPSRRCLSSGSNNTGPGDSSS